MNSRLPRRVILELSRTCRAGCVFCALRHQRPAHPFMRKRTFEQVLPFLDQVKEVTLFGYGESLEHRQFASYFRQVSAVNGLRTYLLTNGHLLGRVAPTLVEGGLDFLAVSLDGATRSTCDSLRPGISFDRVIRNVRRVQEIKRSAGTENPCLRFTFVGMKQNLHEFPALVSLASELGVSEVKFVFLVAHDRRLYRQSLFPHLERYEQVKREARAVARRTGVRLLFPPTGPSEGDVDGAACHRNCRAPWHDFFVGVDGLVRPCMISNQVLGDLKAQSLSDIFNGEGYQELRRRVNSSTPPPDCRDCWQSSCSNLARRSAHFHPHPSLPDAAPG